MSEALAINRIHKILFISLKDFKDLPIGVREVFLLTIFGGVNMRFNWRGHLVVTALTAFSLLPFAGCSSQQQQASDEVEASDGQQGGGGQGEENAAASAQQEGTPENGGNATAEAPQNGAGEEVASNTGESPNAAPAGEGDLQEIISEMGSNGGAAEAAPTAEAAAQPEGAPVAEAAPAPEAAPAAAPSSGLAPVAGMPEMGSKMAYVIEAGDTLGKVATRVYGDQKRWRDISNLSGLSDPNHIFPGDVVYFSLDEASAQFAAKYESLQRSKETVRQGDTLASIAKRVYGSSRSWRHIWRQNDNIDNPDRLTAGMTVYYMNKDTIKTAFEEIKQSRTKQLASKSKFHRNVKANYFNNDLAAN